LDCGLYIIFCTGIENGIFFSAQSQHRENDEAGGWHHGSPGIKPLKPNYNEQKQLLQGPAGRQKPAIMGP
jgi:hypothetical protein